MGFKNLFRKRGTVESEPGEAVVGRELSCRDVRDLIEALVSLQEWQEQGALEGPMFSLTLAYEIEHLGEDGRWIVVKCYSVLKATGEAVSNGFDVWLIEARTGDAYQCLDGSRKGRLKFRSNVFGTRPIGICFLK